MTRRRYPRSTASELGPNIINRLLGGWEGDWPMTDADPDPFAVFDLSEADLEQLWHKHRPALMAEAKKRGITRPWGAQFDAKGDAT